PEVRRSRLLRRPEAAVPAESVRRVDRRTHTEEQDVLLRRLPGAARAFFRYFDRQRADRGDANRQLQWRRHDLRSEHVQLFHEYAAAVSGKCDPGQPVRFGWIEPAAGFPASESFRRGEQSAIESTYRAEAG